MKFQVKQTDLLVLNNLARVASKMFPMVKIEATTSDRLLLTASDGNLTLEAKVKCIDAQGDAVTVDCISFNAIINRLEGDIKFDDGIIKQGRKKFKLPINDTVTFQFQKAHFYSSL